MTGQKSFDGLGQRMFQ